MNRPDTDAQDQLLQIITFGLQRAAGPYKWANSDGSRYELELTVRAVRRGEALGNATPAKVEGNEPRQRHRADALARLPRGQAQVTG